MFEVECKENLCTSLKYPHPPIENREEVYFGCDGSYKKASRVSIECRNYGLLCPEVQAWKEKNKGERFEKCFETTEENSEYGPVKCRTKKPKACPGEDDFWDEDDWENGENGYTCRKDATRYVSYSKDCSKEGEENYSKCKNDGEKLPGRWGEFTRITPGDGENCKNRSGIMDLRFCRPSQNCVIVETLVVKCDNNPFADGFFGNIKLCDNM